MWRRLTRFRPETPRARKPRREAAAQRIRDSVLFDQKWYAHQAGRRFPNRMAAVEHYLDGGYKRFSPHPLFERAYLAERGFPPRKNVDALSAYLANPTARETLAPHPLVDLAAMRKAAGPSGDGCGPLERWLAGATPSSVLPWGDSWWGEPPTLGRVYEVFREVVEESRRDLRLRRADRVHDSLERAVSASTTAPAELPSQHGSPLVSIVVPTYNRAALLRDALGSIQAQGYQNWEAIVVDDGSSDDTAEVVAGVSAFDDRVRLVRGAHAGVSAARNLGLAEAEGEYVAFLDSDNTWEPDYLTVMVATLESNGWDMAHAIQQVDGRDGVTYRAFEGTRDHLLTFNHVDLNVLVVRRALLEKVGGFDESLRRAVDYDLILRLSEESGMHLVPAVGTVYCDDSERTDRISVRESPYWNDVVRNKHLVDRAEDGVPVEARTGVSVLLPIRDDGVGALSWMQRLGQCRRDVGDVHVVVFGAGSDMAAYRLAGGVARLLPRGQAVRTARDLSWPVALNMAVAQAAGEHVVVVRPGAAAPEEDVVGDLVGALRAGAGFAQPLVLREDGTVSSAGAGFAERFPVPYALLGRHSQRDVPERERVSVPAIHSPVFAFRATDMARLGGADPLTGGAYTETELAVRGRVELSLTSVLVPHAKVIEQAAPRSGFAADHAHGAERLRELYRLPPGGSREFLGEAGLVLSGYGTATLKAGGGRHLDEVRPVPLLHVQEPPGGEVPRLRWVIDLAAPLSPRGKQWGDLHFAQSLAAALERLGQHVAVDFREARDRPTRSLDDVLLVIRGRDAVRPRPGQASIQWILSHPEMVTAEECARFDAVFAASTPWSSEMSERWGLPVRPLLQCTDPALFNPERGREDTGAPLLFVGNSRKMFRPVVRAAVEKDHPVAVYGADWKEYLPAGWLKGVSIPNSEVGAYYGSAGVVLNDHWEGMREGGFLSNRLFDAAACGARILSDEVAGIEEIFGGCVRTWESADELDEILRSDPKSHFAGREERLVVARRIIEDHSFDARARQLLDEVLRIRGEGTDQRR